MSRHQKILDSILSGDRDRSIPFAGLCALLSSLEFSERINGSHHIFTREDVEEIVNIQPTSEGKAKPYQVRQVRNILAGIADRGGGNAQV